MEFWNSYFRPTAENQFRLPLGVRSTGHYRVAAGWRDVECRKDFTEIFWGVRGSGELIVDGRAHVLRPETVFCYLAGEVHVIRSREDWEYRWVAFDGPLAGSVLDGFGFGPSSRLVEAGPCPEELFQELERLAPTVTAFGQKQALAVGFNILCCIGSVPGAAAVSRSDRLVEEALALIETNCGDCEFDVTRLAELLGVHRATLFRAFEQALHISPIRYLKALRLQKALLLLKTTRLSNVEVAVRTGFANADYFSRCVREATGLPPGKLRPSRR